MKSYFCWRSEIIALTISATNADLTIETIQLKVLCQGTHLYFPEMIKCSVSNYKLYVVFGDNAQTTHFKINIYLSSKLYVWTQFGRYLLTWSYFIDGTKTLLLPTIWCSDIVPKQQSIIHWIMFMKIKHYNVIWNRSFFS